VGSCVDGNSSAVVLLIEALVAILICAFGLLGFAGMQARATSAEFESYQRSQALVMIEDIVSRMNANRANANAYVTGALIGDGAVLADCNGLVGAPLDLCEWGIFTREFRDSERIEGGRDV
jgi:type IV pilus assembly protein PilV